MAVTRANQSARACPHASAKPNADASANAAADCLTLAIVHAAAICRAHTVSYAVADHLTRRFEYELEFDTGSYAVFHPVRSVTQPSRAVISSLIGVRVGSPKPLDYCVSTCFTKS